MTPKIQHNQQRKVQPILQNSNLTDGYSVQGGRASRGGSLC